MNFRMGLHRFLKSFIKAFCIGILISSCGSPDQSPPDSSTVKQFSPESKKLHKDIYKRLEAWEAPTVKNEIFTNAGFNKNLDFSFFTGGFNCQTKSALWVQHVLDGKYVVPNPKNDNWNQYEFKTDPVLPQTCRSVSEDFTNSGYDRGHLAPAKDFVGYGQKAVKESFYMSNASPQVGIGFNRHLWYNLERYIRSWANDRGQMVVIAGPIYLSPDKKSEYLGRNKVRVPDAFYKIILDISDLDNPEALAFLMDNIDHRDVDYPDSKLNSKCEDNVKSIHNPKARMCDRDNNTNIARHQVTIDEIENLTGINFFPQMPADISKSLESKKPEVWDISSLIRDSE